MNKITLYSLLISLLVLASCARNTIPTVSKKDLKDLNIKPVDFEYLSLRSKINYDDGDRSLGATANFRIHKNDKIWFSVSPGFGIEVARGLVTQDSLYLINKLQKEYYAFSFQELSQRVGVKLEYNILQATLLGEPAKPISTQNKIRREAEETIVLQEEGPYTVANYFSNQTLKLIKVLLQEDKSPNALHITYDDFKNEDGRVIPFNSNLSATYQKQNAMQTTQVAFNHQKAEFSSSPLSFPFNIPDNYVRKK